MGPKREHLCWATRGTQLGCDLCAPVPKPGIYSADWGEGGEDPTLVIQRSLRDLGTCVWPLLNLFLTSLSTLLTQEFAAAMVMTLIKHRQSPEMPVRRCAQGHPDAEGSMVM